MFFAAAPQQGVLADINEELISAWIQVRDHPEEILSGIRSLPVDAITYYQIRSWTPISPTERAVRFIYLNRCCYGGLYRTNRNGEFNVPFGGGSRTPTPLWERSLLLRASQLLRSSELIIRHGDFAETLAGAALGDVCFLDPTYTAIQRGPFDRYNAKLFTWTDQLRLKQYAIAAAQRGAIVIISNVDCSEIRELYSNQLAIQLRRSKAIGNAVRNSHAQHELLIVFDSPEWSEAWIRAASQIAISDDPIFCLPKLNVIAHKLAYGT